VKRESVKFIGRPKIFKKWASFLGPNLREVI
jgi:hypothetical protein